MRWPPGWKSVLYQSRQIGRSWREALCACFTFITIETHINPIHSFYPANRKKYQLVNYLKNTAAALGAGLFVFIWQTGFKLLHCLQWEQGFNTHFKVLIVSSTNCHEDTSLLLRLSENKTKTRQRDCHETCNATLQRTTHNPRNMLITKVICWLKIKVISLKWWVWYPEKFNHTD